MDVGANRPKCRQRVDVLGEERPESELVVRHAETMQSDGRQEMRRHGVRDEATQSDLRGFKAGEKCKSRFGRFLLAEDVGEAGDDGDEIRLEVTKTETLPCVTRGEVRAEWDIDRRISLIMLKDGLHEDLKCLLLCRRCMTRVRRIERRSVSRERHW